VSVDDRRVRVRPKLDAGHDVTTAVQAVEQPLPPSLQR
jgi:hypothetical protein